MNVTTICKRGLLAVALLPLALPGGAAAASGAQPSLTPAQVRVVAEQAGVARGLLRVEDSLTYDAVAARPKRAKLARRIRARNQFVIGLCDTIVRDGIRISTAERRLHRQLALTTGPSIAGLEATIAQATAETQSKLDLLKQRGPEISVADMFEMQMLMNHLSQLSEMSTSVVSASNTAIASLARNVKG